MDIFICHNCGEGKKIVGHRCFRVLTESLIVRQPKAFVTRAQYLDITINRCFNILTFFATGFCRPTKVSSD